jgi:polysaccharide export outer membrane protein
MVRSNPRPRWLGYLGISCALAACAGCATTLDPTKLEAIPHELSQLPLPPYVIESPDVLVIDAVRLVPLPPYRIAPLDLLGIQVVKDPSKPDEAILPGRPIAGVYSVEGDGKVNLGFNYGTVKVDGLTLEEAKEAIEKYLLNKPPPRLTAPIFVTVVLAETKALQQVRGPHLVKTDGTVTLGVYGSVFVDGMTIADAKAAIEEHLSHFLVKPEVSLDVAGFNSKVFYVITDGAGAGAQLGRFPMTGKTTVLDALSQVGGLAPLSSKHFVYVVRPAPSGNCEELVLKVNWNEIATHGKTNTNYQVFPGDRIFILGDPLVTTDTLLARIIAPAERIFGITLLGSSVVTTFRTPAPTNSNTVRLTPF